MTEEEVISWVGEEAERIASIGESYPAETLVPSCPGWTLGDLIEHVAPLLGGWYSYNLTPRPGKFDMITSHVSGYPVPEAYHDRIGHLRGSVVAFHDAARAADLESVVEVFGSTARARFWLRRAATEFAVHRWDAECAGPGPTPLSAQRAGESLDETLREFWPAVAAFEWPAGSPLHSDFVPPAEHIGVRAVDSSRSWRLFRHAGEMAAVETDDLPETVLEGTGSDLVLYVWGRQDAGRLRVHGSLDLIRSWNVAAQAGF
ncbi:MAG TPA: maleylpyruvate isomerase N-terminal domain-containing protein [Pseudonocardia sp.]|jgi:hypothetical protein|nr:maleylpyruvate isomerase N-terminal domain-containing protein [Pseudonocardia sp.]